MAWSSASVEPAPTARPRRRGRGLVIVGGVVAVLALVVAVVSGVEVAAAAGRPLRQAMTNPVRQTPVDTRQSLIAGRYMVFELTGHRSGSAGIGFSQNAAVSLAPDEVTVFGPDGGQVITSDTGTTTETLTRGKDIYTAAVTFVVPRPGTYRVRVDTRDPIQVIVGPSLGSGFARVWGWMLAGGVSALALVAGLLLLIVGVFRGRRAKSAGPMPPQPSVTPAPGWYPDAQAPGRLRYWSGSEWTSHVR
jgi:hypothetical protein